MLDQVLAQQLAAHGGAGVRRLLGLEMLGFTGPEVKEGLASLRESATRASRRNRRTSSVRLAPADQPGSKDGLLAPCRRSPNCVSSQADPSDREHYIAPLKASMEDVRRAVEALPRTHIVLAHPNYLYAEFRSYLGFVDDVEFFFDGAAMQVRSASRLGRRDWGEPRAHREELRRMVTRKP